MMFGDSQASCKAQRARTTGVKGNCAPVRVSNLGLLFQLGSLRESSLHFRPDKVMCFPTAMKIIPAV